MRTRTRATADALHFYACTGHFHNVIQAPMTAIDAAVLTSVDQLLTPDLVKDVVARVQELVEAPAGKDPARHSRRNSRASSKLDRRDRDRWPHAHARPAATGPRQRIVGALTAISSTPRRPRLDWRAVESDARRVLADRRALMHRHVQDARQVLREPRVTAAVHSDPRGGAASEGWRPRADSNCRPSA